MIAPVDELASLPALDPTRAGVVVDRHADFGFDGGRLEFELRRDGDRVYDVVSNYYAVPVAMAWQVTSATNLEPRTALAGVLVLPAAARPNAEPTPLVLASYSIVDPHASYHRDRQFHARFGDPSAQPAPYAYRLPFPTGKAFAVLQGFHGGFSHRGSNEFAVDFDCPVATHVVAARPGVVVATHASAQGAGTTPEYLEYRRTNFVLVLHDDGTLGEYMHLAPSGVVVRPGQRVARGDDLALSGNTGFSSTPHLHFQVMTAADDGIAARSFAFELAVAADRIEEPVQGVVYLAWE